jgi:hypothetical protein
MPARIPLVQRSWENGLSSKDGGGFLGLGFGRGRIDAP